GSPFAAFAAHVPAVLLSSPSDGYALNVAAEALLRSAGDRAVVLAIGDIDHLDRASRSMAFHLAWRNEAFLMTTLRRDVAMPDPVASLWSGGSGEWIDLQPFHHHDVLELLAGVLHGQIDGFLGQRLWER